MQVMSCNKNYVMTFIVEVECNATFFFPYKDDLILTQDLGGAGNSQDAQMNPAAASTNMQQHPVSCSSISQHPAVSNPGSRSRGKRMTIHEKLAIEFHERKLQYLKEEHEVKMKILHLELSMKERDMKQQQCQLSLEQNLS